MSYDRRSGGIRPACTLDSGVDWLGFEVQGFHRFPVVYRCPKFFGIQYECFKTSSAKLLDLRHKTSFDVSCWIVAIRQGSTESTTLFEFTVTSHVPVAKVGRVSVVKSPEHTPPQVKIVNELPIAGINPFSSVTLRSPPRVP